MKIENYNFDELALQLFHYQAQHCEVYAQYLKYLRKDVAAIDNIKKIPFLPIAFFKTHTVRSISAPAQVIFESSGTTQTQNSRHLLTDRAFYERHAISIFEAVYGALSNYHILALLPSYLERDNSSLVYMINAFVKQASEHSGFYLHNYEALAKKIDLLQQRQDKKILLWGVTFALLDLAEQYPMNMENTIVMETGGMKGRRREMTREELHETLKNAFNVSSIHSEYGMTELLSQAYSTGEGIFYTPDSMKILLRDVNDPFEVGITHRSGGINVIDLANTESCAFIETQDLARLNADGGFEVLGRFDNSDLRGCNLLVG